MPNSRSFGASLSVIDLRNHAMDSKDSNRFIFTAWRNESRSPGAQLSLKKIQVPAPSGAEGDEGRMCRQNRPLFIHTAAAQYVLFLVSIVCGKYLDR